MSLLRCDANRPQAIYARTGTASVKCGRVCSDRFFPDCFKFRRLVRARTTYIVLSVGQYATVLGADLGAV
jgi:hypothetical protein